MGNAFYYIIVLCILIIFVLLTLKYLQRRKENYSHPHNSIQEEASVLDSTQNDSNTFGIDLEFKTRESEYMEYLEVFQSPKYPIENIYESIINYDKNTVERAQIYSIETSEDNILIVLENVNIERASILFWCKKDNYQEGMKSIKHYFSGYTMNRRSKLRHNKEYFGSNIIIRRKFLNHLNFDFWKSKMDYYRVVKI